MRFHPYSTLPGEAPQIAATERQDLREGWRIVHGRLYFFGSPEETKALPIKRCMISLGDAKQLNGFFIAGDNLKADTGSIFGGWEVAARTDRITVVATAETKLARHIEGRGSCMAKAVVLV